MFSSVFFMLVWIKKYSQILYQISIKENSINYISVHGPDHGYWCGFGRDHIGLPSVNQN